MHPGNSKLAKKETQSKDDGRSHAKKTKGCFTKKLMSKDTSNILHFYYQQLLNEAEYDEKN